MSLLSVPDLSNENISVLFMPDQAAMIDLEEELHILFRAHQDSGGLLYIDDERHKHSASNFTNKKNMEAKMAIVRRNAKGLRNKKEESRDDRMY